MSRKPIPRIRFVAAPAVVLAATITATLIVALAGLPAGSVAHASQAATPTPLSAATPGDPAADLTTAEIALHGGYIMDPYLLPVVGKTETPASGFVSGCNGFVGNAPSVVLNWSGETEQLNVFVYSDDDAVLVVQKPDGTFACNDDAGARTVDPLVTLDNPAPGAYKIHVGSARANQPALGFLGITQAELNDAQLADLDLSSMLQRRERPKFGALPQLDPVALLTTRAPIFGSAELKAGFQPVQAFAAGGGDIAALRIQDRQVACAGFVNAVPSYSFTWSGSPQPLRLYFEGLKDSSLAVVTPDESGGARRVLCNVDSAAGNLNPALDITAPSPGKYLVYVAAMEPGSVAAGKLTITGDLKATPAALTAAGR